MHSLKSIRQVESVDLQLIYAGATLEYVLRIVEREYVIQQPGNLALGALVQRRETFLGLDRFKDVKFALRIRNRVAHNPDNAAPHHERTRAVKHLLYAIEQHIDLLPVNERNIIRGGQPISQNQTSQSVNAKDKTTRPTKLAPAVSRPSTTAPMAGQSDALESYVRAKPRDRKTRGRSSIPLLISIPALIVLGIGIYLKSTQATTPDATGAQKQDAAGQGTSRTQIELLNFKVISEISPSQNIERICLTADGNTIVTGGSVKSPVPTSTLDVWDARTGQHRRSLGTLRGIVYDVAITPDGLTVASCSSEGVKVWDGRSGRCRHTIAATAPTTVVTDRPLIALTPDGKTVVVGLPERRQRDNTGVKRGTSVSTSDEVSIKVCNALTGQCTSTFAGPGSGLTTFAVSPDGLKVATGSNDKTVKIWNTVTGDCQGTIAFHESEQPLCVAFTPDGFELFVGLSRTGLDKKDVRVLRTFDAHTGRFLVDSQGDVAGAFLNFASGGRLIVAGPNHGNINMIDRQTKKRVFTSIIDDDQRLRSLAVSEDAKTLVLADSENRIKILSSE